MRNELIIGIFGILLAGNGIVLAIMQRQWNKNDTLKKLCTLNNKQGKELVILSTTMDNVLETQELFIDALHEKGILNGNSEPIKQKLKQTRSQLTKYSQQIREEAILIK